MTPRYRFGPFELDPEEGALSRKGTRVRLQDLPYRLLVMLVERPGEIVTREEVRQRLWPENTFVEFDNSLGVAIRKVRDALNDDAEAPHYVETIPRRGYRFIAPVVIQESIQNADKRAVSRPVLELGDPGNKGPAEINEGSRPRSHWMVAVLVLLLLGGAVYVFHDVSHRASKKAEAGNVVAPVRVRRSVAVLGFRNLPGRSEDSWLSPAFSEMLNTELAEGGGLRMISGEDVARAKRELTLTDEDSLSQATLERLRMNPGADVVVLGSYTPLPGSGEKRIRLDVRLQDTARGETIAEKAFAGTEEDLFELAVQAGAGLRESLGLRSISTEATISARAAVPSNEQAARLYAQGRAKLWAFDFVGARDLLVKAVAADPNNPLVHSALSDAWWHLGYEVKARAETQRALELSNHLSQEQRLLVEGQYRRAIEDWPKAVEAYKALFEKFPDSLDYGLLLASAQMHLKSSESLQTLEVLQRLPPPVGDDARIDMVEASAWINTDFTKAKAAARRAIVKASEQGSHLIVARTYGILCQQGPSIGVTSEAINDCENALQSSLAAKDRNGAAMMLSNLAALYYEMGDLVRSETMFRQAIEQFRTVGNPDGVATALSNLAASRLMQGDLAQAKKLLEESIPQYQAVEDKEGVALALNNLGDLSRLSGNLAVAETTYQQAKSTAQEIEDKNALGYVLNGLGDVYLDRGDLVAARKSYEQALALRTETGEKQYAAESRVALARLSIEEGHGADAEVVLRKCRDQFHSDQEADDELTATVALVRSLIAQEREEAAEKEIMAAEPLAAKSQNRLTRLEFDLASARIRFTSDQPKSSNTKLHQILQETRRYGFVSVELDARLALAELDKKTGNKVSAREQLDSLEKSARAKGFGLIARKAAEARGHDATRGAPDKAS